MNLKLFEALSEESDNGRIYYYENTRIPGEARASEK